MLLVGLCPHDETGVLTLSLVTLQIFHTTVGLDDVSGDGWDGGGSRRRITTHLSTAWESASKGELFLATLRGERATIGTNGGGAASGHSGDRECR